MDVLCLRRLDYYVAEQGSLGAFSLGLDSQNGEMEPLYLGIGTLLERKGDRLFKRHTAPLNSKFVERLITKFFAH